MSLTIILSVYAGILTLWVIILTALIAKEKQILQDLSKGVVKKDLISILKQLNGSLKIASDKIETETQRVTKIEQQMQQHFQKSGLVRFNPFSDMGGDQSFSLCLLDQKNNGIVITSLHSRNTTRLYAKAVQSSVVVRADYSDEEWKAYQTAKQSHQSTTINREKPHKKETL